MRIQTAEVLKTSPKESKMVRIISSKCTGDIGKQEWAIGEPTDPWNPTFGLTLVKEITFVNVSEVDLRLHFM